MRIDPRIRIPSGRDIVIEGLPDAIVFGTYAGLGDRVVIRSDETDPANGQRFLIEGVVREGSVFHSKRNHIAKGVLSDPYVTFHGCTVGEDALIGSRTVLDNECGCCPTAMLAMPATLPNGSPRRMCRRGPSFSAAIPFASPQRRLNCKRKNSISRSLR